MQLIRCILILVAAASCVVGSAWGQGIKRGSKPPEYAYADGLLRAAQGSAASVQPPMNAALLFAVGRARSIAGDKKTAKGLFERAYNSLNGFSDKDARGVSALWRELTAQTTTLDPDYVQENLPSEPTEREIAIEALVRHYIARDELQKAIALSESMLSPYRVAGELMSHTSKEQKMERRRIFSIALAAYQKNPPDYITAGSSEDFGSLLLSVWRDVPAEDVLEAIDKLLDQARSDESSPRPLIDGATITLRSANKVTVFNSYYQLRVSQVLPILDERDPSKAETIRQSMQFTPNEFPNQGGRAKPITYQIAFSRSSAVSAAASATNDAQLEEIKSEVQCNAGKLRAHLSSLPSPNSKARALLSLAERCQAEQREEAINALNTLTGIENSGVSWELWTEAATLSATLQQAEIARRLLKRADTTIGKLYDSDSDKDDPNKALKFYWPSTAAWCREVSVARMVSIPDAREVLESIPDSEIKAVTTVALAQALLGQKTQPMESPIVYKPKD